MKTFTPESDARRAAAERIEELETMLGRYRQFADQIGAIEQQLTDAKAEFERLFWCETEAIEGVRK